MTDKTDSHRRTRGAPGDCSAWAEKARIHILESPSPVLESGLERHLKSCRRCKARFGGLLDLDRSIRGAFQTLDQTLPLPRGEALERILRAARESPPDARLLRAIRRPVNTMLWIAMLALSLGGLSALAWGLYVLLRAKSGN